MGVCISGKIARAPTKGNIIFQSQISDLIMLRSNSHSDIHDDYEFLQVIGHGRFGTVREAKKLSNEKRYAVKSILKALVNENFENIRRELSILYKIDHPNVIHLFSCYEDSKYLHIVTELCTGGDLHERIIEQGCFSESDACILMKKIIGAVNYLHSNKISHRDLKPDNFLYKSKRSQDVKLVDFVMANYFGSAVHMNTLAGSPDYLAPEILKGSYTQSCDVWSLGVLLYYMLSSRHPFQGFNIHNILSKSIRGVFKFEGAEWENISDKAKDLISKMLVVHPGNRITLAKALNHQWFTIHTDPGRSTIPMHILDSIRQTKAHSKLWQEALKIVVKTLNSAQINDLKNAFVVMDTNKTGFITAKNLEEAMSLNGFNIAKEEIEKIMRNITYIREGQINYSDFLVATLDKKKLFNDEILWEAFNYFDDDRDALISLQDLENGFKRYGAAFTRKEINDIMIDIEIDDVDMIDFENFKKIFTYSPEADSNEKLAHQVVVNGQQLVRRITSEFERKIEKKKSINS